MGPNAQYRNMAVAIAVADQDLCPVQEFEVRLNEIRDIVVQHGRLSAKREELSPTTDLYGAGLSSLTTVHLMLALEEHFGIEFPANMLSRKTFESIRSIEEAIEELLGAG